MSLPPTALHYHSGYVSGQRSGVEIHRRLTLLDWWPQFSLILSSEGGGIAIRGRHVALAVFATVDKSLDAEPLFPDRLRVA